MTDREKFEHITTPTQNRALKLMSVAKKIKFNLSAVRLQPRKDFIVYLFTDGTSYVVVYCCPAGYLGERRSKKNKEILIEPFFVKNILNFLKKLKAEKYQDFDLYFNSPKRRLSKKEANEIIEGLLADDDK